MNYFHNLIPNETIVIGKVVFLEKDLVTLRIILDNTTIYGYIKSEDLAWEKGILYLPVYMTMFL